MKNIGVSILVNRNKSFAVFALLAVILASGGLSRVLAQGSGDRAIDQAQGAVRERITSREGGRNPTVVFNSDAQTEIISNTGGVARAPSRAITNRGTITGSRETSATKQ
jgi:hypothetical protein